MLRAVGSPAWANVRNKPMPMIAGRRIALIGTSLVHQNSLGTTAPKISWSSRGWWSWALAYGKRRFVTPIWYDASVIEGWEPSGTPGATRYFQGLNFGVSGQTIEQIKARLPYIAANYTGKFDHIVIDGGTNDMGSVAKETIQSDREYICQFFLDMGVTVTLLPILARGTGSWPSGGSERKKANWINRKSREYADRTPGVTIFDWNRYWVDATTADGTPKTGYSPDDIHFNPKGGEPVGKAFVTWLAEMLPEGPQSLWSDDDKYDATDDPYGNLFPTADCFLIGGTAGTNGTGSSGVVPTGLKVERSSGSSCSVVNDIVARADGRGNDLRMTFTMGGAAEEKFLARTAAADTAHTLAGKWVKASCNVVTNASDMIYGIVMYLEDANGTGGVEAYCMDPYDSGSGKEPWAAQERDILIETPAFLLTSNGTNMRWRVEIYVKNVGSVAPVIRIGEIEFRQVDDPRS